ncbi:MAG: hypothetical protein WBA17_01950, partial [Saprospiraceae bacterium]
RYYVQTKLVNTVDAETLNNLVNTAPLIETGADDFAWQYGTTRANPDSRHPYYSDGYEDGGPGFYMSNYMMWFMFSDKPVEDPRLRYYFYRQDCDETNEDDFTLDCAALPPPDHYPPGTPWCTASGPFSDPLDNYSGYWGRDHGNDDGIPPDDLKRSAWGQYPAGGLFDANQCEGVSNGGTDGLRGAGIQPILLSSFVEFLRAEAVLTMGASGDAAAFLEAGMRESMMKVRNFGALPAGVDPQLVPTDSIVDLYITTVLDEFNSADADGKMQVLAEEFYIAAHGWGLDIYNLYRRTGKPAGFQPVREPNPGPFPRTFWYPASFVNRNSSVAQKTDLTTQVFWDTNPAGFIK